MCNILWYLMSKRFGAFTVLTAELTRVKRGTMSVSSPGGADADDAGNTTAAAMQSVQLERASNRSFDDYESLAESGGGLEEELEGPCISLFFVLDFAHEYCIPFIILLGLIGNLLSCVVFLNTHLKMRSSSYYLAALSTADFSFLFSLLLVWLNNNVGWLVFNRDGWCEAVVYVSSVCSSLSVWLIVGFTVERFIAVQYPLHRPHMCTIARAKTIVVSLTLVAMVSHSYCFVTAGVVKQPDGTEMCDMKLQYLEAMRVVSIIDTVSSLMAPLVMIVIMNTMIMRNLFYFSQRFGQTPGQGFSEARCPSRERSDVNLNHPVPSASSSDGTGNGIALGSGIAGRRQSSQQSFHSSKNSHSQSRSGGSQQMQPAMAALSTGVPSSIPRNAYNVADNLSRRIHVRVPSRNLLSTRNQQSITKMLLVISTVFVTLNMPSYIIRLCVFFFTVTRQDTPTLLWCLQQFFMLLYYTNFSTNFILYAMCGSTFRRCLWQLLCKIFKNVIKYPCNLQRYI